MFTSFIFNQREFYQKNVGFGNTVSRFTVVILLANLSMVSGARAVIG
jgi:hypothetical protein